MRDLYEVMGLQRNADPERIKAVYWELAKRMHPDTGGDPAAFAELSEAYAVLSNGTARKHYDETGQVLRKVAKNPDVPVWNGIMEFIAGLVINDNIDLAKVDVLAMVRDDIDKNIADYSAKVAGIEVRRARIADKIIPRMKRKHPLPEGEVDPMDDFLRAQLDQIDRGLAQLRMPLEQLKRARILLEDYRYEFEAPAALPPGYFPMGQAPVFITGFRGGQ